MDHPAKTLRCLLPTAMLAVAGCPLQPGNPDPAASRRLNPFQSRSQLVDYFKDQAYSSATRPFRSGIALFGGGVAEDASAAPQANGDDGSGDADFTTTNLQEAGVDEADVVKTDGRYFYIAREQSLRIVDAQADPLAEVGRLDLDDTVVDELYLRENQVIVIGRQLTTGSGGGMPFEPVADIAIWPPYVIGAGLVVVSVDVTDPAAPVATARSEFDGWLVSSRLIEDRLHLVLTITPELPARPLEILTLNADDVLPEMRTSEGAGDLVPWERWLRPEDPDGYQMTAIVTLDAGDVEQVTGSAAIMAAAGTIYASREALYVTDTEYDPDQGYRESTAIHKLAFSGEGATYVASGTVPGRLLNQFSLGEHEGALRVATHVSAAADVRGFGDDAVAVDVGNAQSIAPSNEPTNAVYVLQQVDGDLAVAGGVEGLAPGERIYSARFMGDRGFLVTFRQIDPLFVLDLSDPGNPAVTGELKIPGYSDYLHPLGEDRLIGVGRSTTTRFGGVTPDALQLSLFDVSDVSNPTLIDQVEFGGLGSASEVSSTHKAFTLSPDGEMLAVPAYLTESDAFVDFNGAAFSGVLCVRVDPANGFSEVGRLAAVGTDDPIEPFFYGVGWQRAAFIGEMLYALSPAGVRAAGVANFEEAQAVTLGE